MAERAFPIWEFLSEKDSSIGIDGTNLSVIETG